MFAIDDPTAVTVAPSVPEPTGASPGFFYNGNPASGVAATLVPDWWLNQIQGELLTIVNQAGITPAKGVNTQVKAALDALYGGSSSQVANGWAKLPGGLMIQWAQGVSASGYQETVYFPTPFPKNLFAVNISGNDATQWETQYPNTGCFPSWFGTAPLASAPLSGFLLMAAAVQFNNNFAFQNDLNYNYIAIGN